MAVSQNLLATAAADDLVFHYTRLCIATSHILPKMEILMTRYSATKDPYERHLRPAQTQLPPGAPLPSERGFLDLMRRRDDAFRSWERELRVLSTCRDQTRRGSPAPPEVRGYGKSRMWAQYAENHAGVCLVLDRRQLKSQIVNVGSRKNTIAKRVKYRVIADATGNLSGEQTVVGDSLTAVQNHFRDYSEWFLFTKPADYRDEREFRFVIMAASGANEMLIPIDGALKGVVAGLRTPVDDLQTLLNLCEPACIPLYQMEITRGEFVNPRGIDRGYLQMIRARLSILGQ